MAPGIPNAERTDFTQVVLEERLRTALPEISTRTSLRQRWRPASSASSPRMDQPWKLVTGPSTTPSPRISGPLQASFSGHFGEPFRAIPGQTSHPPRRPIPNRQAAPQSQQAGTKPRTSPTPLNGTTRPLSIPP